MELRFEDDCGKTNASRQKMHSMIWYAECHAGIVALGGWKCFGLEDHDNGMLRRGVFKSIGRGLYARIQSRLVATYVSLCAFIWYGHHPALW